MKSEKHQAQKLWAHNKYLVLSKSQNIYKDIRQYLKSDEVLVQTLQDLIDQAIGLEEDKGEFINASQHIWGYFKKKASRKEKQDYIEVLQAYQEGQVDRRKILSFLYGLLDKYPNDYLANSTIFDRVR